MSEKNPVAGRAEEKSALAVTTITSFMGPFAISSVNVALPAIQNEFAVDAVMLSWVATAYLLSMAVFLVPVGKIADIYGRKRMFTGGLTVFTLATLASVFTGSIEAFIAWRVIQGLGAAMFVTTGMAILISVFPPERRGRAIGIYVAAVYIGLSVGPFGGGLLTGYFGWRAVFVAVLPLGAASVAVTLKFLKGEWADARGERLDLIGSLLYGVAVVALVCGAAMLPETRAVGIVTVGLAAMILFVVQEQRTAHPVFDVRLFSRNRLFAFSSLAALIHYSATFAVTFLVSLYLQYIKGMNPQTAGTVLVAQPLVMALLSPVAGRMSDRVEPRRLASTGMALTALGLVIFAFTGSSTPTYRLVGNLVLLGLGFALFSSPNMSAIMGAVEKRLYGIASGAVATMRLLGQMLSMAIATVVFALLIGRTEIAPENYPDFLKSMRLCFSAFAMLCAAGIFFSLFRGRMRR
jgi:EmrB/QacA subfamily drug resistance transporter